MSILFINASDKGATSRSIVIQKSLRLYSIIGLTFSVVMFGGAILWSLLANVEGAVMAQGLVVVQSNLQKVQHPSGGIVAEIFVKDGQFVHQGAPLLRLDETITRANLRIINDQLNQLSGRQSRLEAERDNAEMVTFKADLMNNADAASIMAGEKALFHARYASRASQHAKLKQRIVQLNQEIIGYTEQIDSKAREITLIQQELKGVQSLYNTNLVPLSRLTSLQREETRLTGERGQLLAQLAATRGKISEIELQIFNIVEDLRSEVTRDLRDVEAKTMELSERQITAQDQLGRMVLYAPVSGVVHQLNVHTIEGVIQAGESLMMIVPQNDTLTIEARIQPSDIDSVKIHSMVYLKFMAFDSRKTPEVMGRVSMVSADLVQTAPSVYQEPYYKVKIELMDEEVDKLNGKQLVPGMPVEVFISTENRTAFSYLTKPLFEQFSYAFREK